MIQVTLRLIALLFLVATTMVGASTVVSADAQASEWTLSATTSVTGNQASIKSTFVAGATGSFTFDTEVYDNANQKVAQEFVVRSVTKGRAYAARYLWSIPLDGEYIVKQGVFGEKWGPLQKWSEASARFQRSSEGALSASPAIAPQSTPTPTALTPDSPAAPAAPKVENGQNPLAGVEFFGNHPNAATQAAAWQSSRPQDAALMAQLAAVPMATWFGSWNPDVRADVSSTVAAARAQNKVPVLVAYNVPGRDCGGYSGGGAAGEANYRSWIYDFAAGIGTTKAVVILEPDALGLECGDLAARYRSINDGVTALSKTGAVTYLDASHWVSPSEMADRLRRAGVDKTRGFALNTSNFNATTFNTNYGETISAYLGGAHYVVDVSRNGGNVVPGQWCNPTNAALGQRPTTKTTAAHADAFVWTKPPGASDGNCNGGPNAGEWWPDYALYLAKSAGWK